jgi:metallo-beta-lactamase class B
VPIRVVVLIVGLAVVAPLTARQQTAPAPPPGAGGSEWNVPHQPFQVYGNTFFVGTNGLSAVLIASPEGHVLIDGALPESVPQITANMPAMGFRIEDVKLILNSHVHFDHAGGLAALQRLSNAQVAASPSSRDVLERGTSGPDDPQFGLLPPIARVGRVRTVADGEVLRVGSIAVTAHFTPGHTPGGTSWSWESCEASRCMNLVYADSLTPVSADGFQFTRSTAYPNALKDFEKSFTTLEALSCDILLTPHPGASNLWARLERRNAGAPLALVDNLACRRYAAAARDQLAKRVSREASP